MNTSTRTAWVIVIFCFGLGASMGNAALLDGDSIVIPSQVTAPKSVQLGPDKELVSDLLAETKKDADARNQAIINKSFSSLRSAIDGAQGPAKGNLQSRFADAKLYLGERIGAEAAFREIADGIVPASPEVLSDRWDSSDPYKNFNVRGYALLYKSLSLSALGRSVESETVLQRLSVEEPSWYESIGNQELTRIEVGYTHLD